MYKKYRKIGCGAGWAARVDGQYKSDALAIWVTPRKITGNIVKTKNGALPSRIRECCSNVG